MIFKVLTIFVLTCSNLTFMSETKRSSGIGKTSNNENFQSVNEKKIHFTGNSEQYIKFDAKLPNVLDFAMCVWYKPQVILDNNILFSYGSKDQQLILWKIKKKQQILTIILKILNTKIMEEKLETLSVGQWHHLCQYWQGSTGLWSLFLNTYIVSFGYNNMVNTTNWYSGSTNISATVNHPNTKKTLHGEIYGFYLMSTNFESDLKNSDGFKLLPTPLPGELTRKRRQVENFDPVTPESRTPFFRLRNFFKFIRRMISLVTVPVFRFARRLIQPWTRRFVPLGPTTDKTAKPTTAAPPTSTLRTLAGNSTTQNVTNPPNITASSNTSNSSIPSSTQVNGTSARDNLTDVKTFNQKLVSGFTEEHFDSFDESIIVYEPEYEPPEQRPSRNVMNLAKPPISILDSVEVLASSSEEKSFTDRCTFIAEKIDNNVSKLNSSENFVTPSSEKSVDAITQLGPHLQFVQFLYSCCPLEGSNVLISWEETKVMLNNVATETIEGCGNF